MLKGNARSFKRISSIPQNLSLQRCLTYRIIYTLGAIQVLRNADGVEGGGVTFSGKKRYEGVMFNVISVTRGWLGVQFPGK